MLVGVGSQACNVVTYYGDHFRNLESDMHEREQCMQMVGSKSRCDAATAEASCYLTVTDILTFNDESLFVRSPSFDDTTQSSPCEYEAYLLIAKCLQLEEKTCI